MRKSRAQQGSCCRIGFIGILLASGCGLSSREDDAIPDAIGKAEQELWGGNVVTDTTSTDGPVGAVGTVTGVLTCTGTLVFSRSKVLTAAHCFACTNGERATFTVNGTSTDGDVECSPLNGTGEDEFFQPEPNGAFDIAVITLDSPVPAGVVGTPMLVFRGSIGSAKQAGALDLSSFLLVGRGFPCHPTLGSCFSNGERRFGVTTSGDTFIDHCDAFPESIFEGVCSNTRIWKLERSDEEANFGIGDSGSPMYLDYQGNTYVAGAASVWSEDEFDGEGFFYAPPTSSASEGIWLTEILEVPEVTSLADLAVLGTGSAAINDRAVVEPAVPTGPSPDVAGGNVNVGADASVAGDVYSRGVLFMRERSSALGVAQGWSVMFQNDVTVSSFQHASAPIPSLEEFGDFLTTLTFDGTEDVTLFPDQPPQVVPLEPGKYDDVMVFRGRWLQLEPGTYYFKTLVLDDQSVLSVTGTDPTYVYVSDALILRGGRTGSNPDLLIGFRGSSDVPVDRSHTATIVAPNGGITLAPGYTHIGALLANQVTVHQDSSVRFRPFPFSWEQP